MPASSDVARPFSIYIIVNILASKAYIGLSRDPERRYRDHWKTARRGRGWLIHDAMRKYGKEAFVTEVLYTDLTSEEAAMLEMQLIREYMTLVPQGYNLTDGGEGAFNAAAIELMRKRLTGRKMSEEFKAACALRKLGSIQSEEVKQKIREARIAYFTANPKTVTPEEAARLRTLSVGRKNTAEHNEAIRKAQKGVPKTEEAKIRMRTAALNRAPGHNEAIRQARLGTAASEETKARMTASHKARWALRKAKLAAD